MFWINITWVNKNLVHNTLILSQSIFLENDKEHVLYCDQSYERNTGQIQYIRIYTLRIFGNIIISMASEAHLGVAVDSSWST